MIAVCTVAEDEEDVEVPRGKYLQSQVVWHGF
jgi:hypothetical protein